MLRKHQGAVDKMKECERKGETLCITSLTAFELLRGPEEFETGS